MERNIIRLALLISLLGLQLGCAPVYRTFYSFTPPTSSEGKMCVMQCENTKVQCEQIADMKAENCRRDARSELDKCKAEGSKYCPEQACEANYAKCNERYNSCYSVCGGRVEAESRCVRHCPKAGATAPPPAEDAPGSTPPAAGPQPVNQSVGGDQTCTSCGRAGPAGKFCSHCGKPMGGVSKCKCGNALPSDARFCPKCGTKTGK